MSAEPVDLVPTATGHTADAVPGVAKSDPILVADSVRRQFGGLVAVDVDHVEVQRGEITALIGPNGAGKTTFFNLLTGFDDADHGQWYFDGEQVAGRAPHKLARIGHGSDVPAHQGACPPVGDAEHAPRRQPARSANGCGPLRGGSRGRNAGTDRHRACR